VSIKIELEISDKDVADLLCSAIEGGYGREWCKEIDAQWSLRLTPKARPWGDEHTPDYIAAPFTDGAALIVRVHTEHVGTPYNLDEAPTRAHAPRIQAEYRVTRKELAAGLHAMATKHPKHFGDFISDNADAITGDVFLQCCTFGEIVFG
jgi:hypothetical protein